MEQERAINIGVIVIPMVQLKSAYLAKVLGRLDASTHKSCMPSNRSIDETQVYSSAILIVRLRKFPLAFKRQTADAIRCVIV